MKAAALGYLQLTPAAFYDMTYDELVVMVRGKREHESLKARHDYEVARFLAHRLLQPHVKKGHRLNLSQVAEFPWERKTTAATADDLARLRKLAQQESARLKAAKSIHHEPVR